ncbi:aldehyde oxidoreductase [Streptomyces sp. NBRC 110611]|uniref:2Fe-2S iron-sulfur cluster-binding protein n=1 Tax=Streptomyces sp. NBRC 110611 TaxID=1621259 RepID=UPI0008297131|nr:2Fe-2S iron-sulfur cluster-binding protein [Streptomyces sp. NBRC 110611]GAU67964.1 aldehyde oxidoreductase [Streptomyces sp. NBRC 110611]
MSDADSRHPQQQPADQGWQPLPQGGEYEQEATAFVQLPEGFTTGVYGGRAPDRAPGADPLAAPGHGYTPPASFTPQPPAPPVAGTDPAATGQWTMPFADPSAGYADPSAGYAAPTSAHTDGTAHHDPSTGYQGGAPGGAQPWGGGAPVQWPEAGGPQTGAPYPGGGTWSVPAAADDGLEESGEYRVGGYQDGGYPHAGAYRGADAGTSDGTDPDAAARTGHWNFTTGLSATHLRETRSTEPQEASRGAADEVPFGAPADGSYAPESGFPGRGTAPVEDHRPAPAPEPAPGGPDAMAGGATGHWSLPADALAQWPPATETARPAHDGASDVPAPAGAAGWTAAPAPTAPVNPTAPIADGERLPDSAELPPSGEFTAPDEAEQTEAEAEVEAEDAADASSADTPATPDTPDTPQPDTRPEAVVPAESAPESAPETAPGELADHDDGTDGTDGTDGSTDRAETAEAAEAAEGAEATGATEGDDGTDPLSTDTLNKGAEAPAAPHGEHHEHNEHPAASYVLRVNGIDRPVTDAWIGESLLYVLRERLGLAGAKDGCSQGECGACSVQVDGRLVASCLVPAATAAGSEVRTVEGLARNGAPSDVQCALAASGAVQCGFCVPGMAMTVHDLLEGNPAPSELETRKALCGNLCRCSGYRGVLDAVEEVVKARAEAAEAAEAAPSAEDGPAVAPPPDTARIPHQAGPADPMGRAPHDQDPHTGGTA